MKIEKAYSTELDEVVDVETAYDLFWAGHITDKHKFECVFPECDGAITAANLDRLRQDMAVDPHYRKVGEHAAACKADTATKDTEPAPGDEARGRSRGQKNDDLADVFGLKRPPSHAIATRTPDSGTFGAELLSNKRRKKREATERAPRASTHYSLLSFVSKYHRYRKLAVCDTKFINIKGYNVAYSEMFVPIEDQDFATLSDYPRVYFGKAYIDERPNEYRIGFISAFVFEGVSVRPSIFISKNLIQNAFSRKLSEAKFDELSKRKRPDAWVFVYAKPRTAEKDGKTYINFSVTNLDFFDFRETFDVDLHADAL